MIGRIAEWAPITSYLQEYLYDDKDWATVVASTFSASLEMVREGKIEMRQTGAFQPVYVRAVVKDSEHEA